MRSKKAQAALEFLMSYGWAILAVMVAIGALAYFGVFDVSKTKTTTCLSGTEVHCLGSRVGSYTVTTPVINSLSRNIEITNFSADVCTISHKMFCWGEWNSEECNDSKTFLDDSVDSVLLNSEAKGTIYFICEDKIEESKKTNLVVDYRFSDSTLNHQVSMNINYKVVTEPQCPYTQCGVYRICQGTLHPEYTPACCEGICKFQPPLCFAAGTKILMDDGSYKSIEDIKAGDKVVSKEGISDVEKTGKYSAESYLIINGLIKVTPEHPFYANGEWKKAKELKVGDYLLNENNKLIEITNIDQVSQNIDVYNFQTTLGTYYAEDVLVHNKQINPPTRE